MIKLRLFPCFLFFATTVLSWSRAESVRLSNDVTLEIQRRGGFKYQVNGDLAKDYGGVVLSNYPLKNDSCVITGINGGYQVKGTALTLKDPKNPKAQKEFFEFEVKYVKQDDGSVLIHADIEYLTTQNWRTDLHFYFPLVAPDKQGIVRDIVDGSSCEVTYADGKKVSYSLPKEYAKAGEKVQQFTIRKQALMATVKPGKDTQMRILDNRTITHDNPCVSAIGTKLNGPKGSTHPGEKDSFEIIVTAEKNKPEAVAPAGITTSKPGTSPTPSTESNPPPVPTTESQNTEPKM
jgi:hypothetical protein